MLAPVIARLLPELFRDDGVRYVILDQRYASLADVSCARPAGELDSACSDGTKRESRVESRPPSSETWLQEAQWLRFARARPDRLL
jgi:hypothetical protein